MFKAPFSFTGRIRRKEFGISFLIYFVAGVSLEFGLMFGQQVGDSGGLILLLCLVPIVWFMLAQAAKRSHDIGNSGWWVLIPFYAIILLFAESNPGPNQYGDNPKGVGNDVAFDFEAEAKTVARDTEIPDY